MAFPETDRRRASRLSFDLPERLAALQAGQHCLSRSFHGSRVWKMRRVLLPKHGANGGVSNLSAYFSAPLVVRESLGKYFHHRSCGPTNLSASCTNDLPWSS